MNESIIQKAMESADPLEAERAFHELDLEIQLSDDVKEKAGLVLRKAVLYGVLRRFVDARRQLNLALQEAPDDDDIRFQFDFIGSSLYDQEGNPAEALARLTSLLSTHAERLARPGDRPVYEDIQLRRGLDFARTRRFREAVPPLEESLSFDLKSQDRSDVLSNLGFCLFELQDYEGARPYLLRACELGVTKEWSGYVHLRLAIACANLSLFSEAKQEFLLCEERAGEYGLEINKVYGWLSWVCKGLGEKAQAEKYDRLSRPI